MSAFQNATLEAAVLDPYKRVRYSNGLVLGVDEFLQEQLYFLEKDRLHARQLHGYGTVCGLAVEVRPKGDDQEVVVDPGYAVSPRGQDIRVGHPQCASLNTWLALNGELVEDHVASPPGDLSLYVVLCYAECETDLVPIPSGPCMSLEDTSAPSRIEDAFELRLTPVPPEQPEEEAVRAFGDLLRTIEITADAGAAIGLEELLDRVRALAEPESSPAVSPPPGSPPGPIPILAEDAEEFLRAAFRVWVTEVRPEVHSTAGDCSAPAEECVLLARLDVPLDLSEGVYRVAGAPAQDEGERPYLLHTRLLQEWLDLPFQFGGPGVGVHADLAGLGDDDHLQYLRTDGGRALSGDWDVGGAFRITNLPDGSGPTDAVAVGQAVLDGDAAGGDLGGTYPDPDVVGLQGSAVSATAPTDGQVLAFDGGAGEWRPADATGGAATDHGALAGLGDDDHSQYLLADGGRELGGDWDVGGSFRITNMPDGSGPGDAVTVNQAVLDGDAAGGDLGGAYPDPSVAGLQGSPVSADPPADGEVLTFDEGAGEWQPQVPAAASSAREESDLTRILALSWAHAGLTDLRLVVDGADEEGIAIAFGQEDVGDAGRVQVVPGSLGEDTLQLFIEREFPDPVSTVPLRLLLRVTPREVRHVKPAGGAFGGGLFTDLETADQPDAAEGAALLLEKGILQELLADQAARFVVVLHGDLVLDQTGKRAVDAEFLRATLPSGDRPEGIGAGVQGGTFTSWVTALPGSGGIPIFDINVATVADLLLIPGIGPILATAIVAERASGPFTSVEDLTRVPGVGPNLLERLRPFVTVNP